MTRTPAVTVIAFIGIVIPASAAPQRPLDLQKLPSCTGDRSTTSNWEWVPFDGWELLLPQGMRQLPYVSEHGGMNWERGSVQVIVSRGIWGQGSFDTLKGKRCRTDVNGHEALVIENAARSPSITVWVPTLKSELGFYRPLVRVNSSRKADLPLLRAIAFSLRDKAIALAPDADPLPAP